LVRQSFREISDAVRVKLLVAIIGAVEKRRNRRDVGFGGIDFELIAGINRFLLKGLGAGRASRVF